VYGGQKAIEDGQNRLYIGLNWSKMAENWLKNGRNCSELIDN
jgi:hypothetical protein